MSWTAVGVVRSSSASTRGREAGRRGVRRARAGLRRAIRGRSQLEMRMVDLHCGSGLRYNGDDITGARRPYARAVFRPVRSLLGGRASPAALFLFPFTFPLAAWSNSWPSATLAKKGSASFGGRCMAEAVKTEHPHIVRLEG